MPVPQSRTQWAERQAEELLSVPFIAEFVLRSPQMIDGTQTFRGVDLQSAAADLPLAQGKTPLTYISVNDFLNVATLLRTVPELLRYLDARRELPEAALRRLGDE